jgi:hypothetical protein
MRKMNLSRSKNWTGSRMTIVANSGSTTLVLSQARLFADPVHA